MRRKDRARDPAFAWLVFDQAAYGVLSMRDEGGGYGVPVSPARIGEKIYFHCAMEGKKVDCLSRCLLSPLRWQKPEKQTIFPFAIALPFFAERQQ